MFSAGDPSQGAASYVAIELATGKLAGRHGSFALQHMATIDHGARTMTVAVVPGSGTGDLVGIAGALPSKLPMAGIPTSALTPCRHTASRA